jgi:hypothetical protein
MDRRYGLGTLGAGLGVKLVTLLIIILLFPSCSPNSKADEELRGEIKDLKKEVKALGEKLDKLEAGQQALLMVLKPAAHPPEAVALPPQPPQFQPPAMPAPLTVGQLLAGKDKYLGARVTVKGEVGPVLVHHKSLLLKSPQGMVEVLFGKLPDQNQVQRLTSTPIDQQLTVTGVVNLAPGTAGAAKLQINAESID